MKSFFREKEFWLMICIGILFFYRPVFLGETFFFRDIYQDVMAHKQLLSDFFHTGELPLWNAYLDGGQPYLADVAYFVLYPTNLLYLFLSPLTAFNLNIVLHYSGASASAYLLARTLRFPPYSSLITGIVYAFSGYALSLANLGGRFLVLPHIPLLLLCWHRYLVQRKSTWFVLTVIIGVMQVFAGAPETSLLSLLLVAGWTILYPYANVSFGRKIGYLALLVMFILGIAAIQLFPTAEMASLSVRQGGLSYNSFAQWSLFPKRLPELFFPGLSGSMKYLPATTYYWGGTLVDDWNPCVLSIYTGMTAFFLAFTGGWQRKHSDRLPFTIRRGLLVCFCLSLILSLGRFLPFFQVMYDYIPFMKLFRYPIKFFIAGILPLALLTGYGVDEYFGTSAEASGASFLSKKLLLILWGTAVMLILLTVSFSFSDRFAEAMQHVLFDHSGGDIARRGIRAALLHTTMIWMGVTLVYHYRNRGKRAYAQWLLAAIVIIDILTAGQQVNFYAPRNLFTDVPPLAALVQHEIDDGRLFQTEYTTNTILKIPVAYVNDFHIPPQHIIWGTRWSIEMLFGHFAPLYRIPIIFHEPLALGSRRMTRLKTLMYTLPWEQRLHVLSAAHVTLILTSEAISVPGMSLVAEIPNWSDLPIYLYRNTTATQRTRFVTAWETVHSESEALEAMTSWNFNPQAYAVVQITEPDRSIFSFVFGTQAGESVQHRQPSAAQKCPPAHILPLQNRLHASSMSVSNSCDGYLVFSDPFYPGWKVRVDGQTAPLVQTNYAFSSIFLEAGEHAIKRYYQPQSLMVGSLVTLFCCALLGILCWTGRL